MIERGFIPIFQSHDEILLSLDPSEVPAAEVALQESIDFVNLIFNHPIKFNYDYAVGDNYAAVH